MRSRLYHIPKSSKKEHKYGLVPPYFRRHRHQIIMAPFTLPAAVPPVVQPAADTASSSLLPPPSDVFFPTQEALLGSAKEGAATHGYALTIARSKPGKVYLQYDWGGSYRNRRRRTGTRLISCPFSAVGVSKDGSWHLIRSQ